MSAFKYLWQKHRAPLVGLALALVVALFFAVRFAAQWVYWSDPAHRDVQIQGWMTPGYVAQSYRVDTDVIRAALPPTYTARPKLTLEKIAVQTNANLDSLIQDLEKAIATERASRD